MRQFSQTRGLRAIFPVFPDNILAHFRKISSRRIEKSRQDHVAARVLRLVIKRFLARLWRRTA
jgi:hypothetical protein